MPRLGSGQGPVDCGPGRISPDLPGGDRGGVRLLDPLPVDPDMACQHRELDFCHIEPTAVLGGSSGNPASAECGWPPRMQRFHTARPQK
jgi:hypothetical protein